MTQALTADRGRLFSVLFAVCWLAFRRCRSRRSSTGRRPIEQVAGGCLAVAGFSAVYPWYWVRPHRLRAHPGPLIRLLSLTAIELSLASILDGGREPSRAPEQGAASRP